MKKTFLAISILILFTFSATAQQNWVSFYGSDVKRPEITVEESDNSKLILEISIPGMYVTDILEGGQTWQKLELIEFQTTHDVGMPELPMINEIIGIPGNKKIKYRILESSSITLNNYNVFPSQMLEKDVVGGKSDVFTIDKDFYNSNISYPENNLFLDESGIWRDVIISGFHFTPFNYNPATKALEVITEFKVEIEFYGIDTERILKRTKKEVTPKFYKMYESSIINFGSLGFSMNYRDDGGIKYLIITNTNPAGTIQPLVDWKNEQGSKVEVKLIMNGFEQPQQFKDYITQLYESDGLEYVLMVGDAFPNGGSGGGPDMVPMYYWNPGGGDASYSDSWYTCLDGADDHYADLAIGRFVYDNLTELALQIQKTLDHYTDPDVSTNWAENSLLVAHKENYPSKYTACKEEIRTHSYLLQSPIFTTCYGGAGANNNTIIDFVNNTSCGIFNYRGHGSGTEFWQWCNAGSFTNTHIQQFTNDDKLFVLFDVCCDNMNIVNLAGDCLCESFMKSPVAAVAINGAIIPSYTIPNHDYDKEMYKAVFNEAIYNIGYVTNYANITVLNNHGSSGKSNVRTYLWLGDASLEPWTLQPTDLTVDHEDHLYLGLEEFEVTVTSSSGYVENAMVCLSNEDKSVYGVAYTNASGYAVVQLEEPVQQMGLVTFTVTAHNFLPYQVDLPVDGTPSQASTPVPGNGEPNVVPFTNLFWSDGFGGIPEEYKVYLGSDNPPTNITNGEVVTDTMYIPPSSFDFNTEYFWRIDSYNEFGSSTGDVWSFTISSPPDEDFESGDFSANDWYFGGDTDWVIDNTVYRHGTYSAKSGNIATGQSTSLLIELEAESFFTVPIIFWLKTSTHDSMNTLQLLIDGNVAGEWSDENDWIKETFMVFAGLHTFEWKYTKTTSTGGDDDCVWIDYIKFPPNSSTMTVYAGPDAQICTGDSYPLSGDAQNYETIEWTTSGDGVFDDNTILNPVYTPGSTDIEEGSVILTITANDGDRASATDEMTLTIHPLPEVYAGGEGEICGGDNYQTSYSSALNCVSFLWTSSGDGTFTNDTELNTVYSPGPDDLINGQVSLMLSGWGMEPCGEVSDELLLSISEDPEIPSTPSGPDYVDVYYTPTSEYSTGSANATSYLWDIVPDEAGYFTGNENTAIATWSDEFQGEAMVRVKGVNICGESIFSEGLVVLINNTVGFDTPDNSQFRMSIIPNPSFGISDIGYHVPVDSRQSAVGSQVSLSVYDIHGQKIRTLVNENQPAGKYSIHFDGSDLPGGIYFLRLQAGDRVETAKMVLMR